uniref:Localization factor PodJL n=1 Tax=Candidatus Berkiella aquae TaxID=295108 RepID=A0A0Q9YJQ8_9GAMM
MIQTVGAESALEICTKEAQSGDPNAQIALANLYLDGTLAKEDWQQAMPWFLLAAEQGHPEAQMQVAHSLQLGRGIAKSDEQAFFWLQQAAKGNDPQAQVALAQCYLQGKGVPKDTALAIQWLVDCAKKGNNDAIYQLAQIYLEPANQNINEAQSLLHLAAQNGHALAMFTLAKLYHEGNLIEKDDSKALYWYAQANAKDHPQAEYELAMLLLKGTWQVNENPISMLHKSAEQNYAPAQLALAKLYQQGQKVGKDENAAFNWYLAAAKEADPEAYYQIGLCFVHGQLKQPKNIELGIDYLKKSAELGWIPAQYTLASLYLDGHAVLDDRQQAMDYLIQAANNGWIDAQLKLAQALIQFSLPQYDKAAFHWVQKASKYQHADALFQLASCYHEGIGTPVDYQQALTIYQGLASRDHFLAQCKLGQMYFEGQGVEKNPDEAKKWLLQAANHRIAEASDWLKLYFNETDETLTQLNTENEINEWLYSESGTPQSQFEHGMNYLYARQGKEQNIPAGISLIQEAAEKEYLPAQRELAIIYEQGLFGLQKAANYALTWYLRAANSGDEYSQYRAANMYYTGQGAAKNAVQAYAFADMAAAKGFKEAVILRDELATQLNENEMAVADMLARTQKPENL